MEMCKTQLGFAHFHRHGWHELKTTKPDRSFATKTGHFHLLLTGYSLGHLDREGVRPSVKPENSKTYNPLV